MSDNDDDLFADSDDTAELIGSKPEPVAKKVTKKLGGGAAKRKRNEEKEKIPDADDDDDDDKGLFDSDDDDSDNEDSGTKTKPPVKKAKNAAPAKKTMSKRERMEALQKKKRAATSSDEPIVSKVPEEKKKSKPNKEGGDNSDTEDSYNSADFQLNEDDRNFIDTEGDDADAINELYSEQHFDDVRGEAEEDMSSRKKNRKGGSSGRGGGRKGEALEDNGDLDNPIMAAVHRMKKKKREARKTSELEEEAKDFMERMERAAEEDEVAVRERRPATKKLSMLNEVMDMFTKRDMTRVLLDLDVLSICKRWVQPLPNGKLGNVTIRQRMLESIANMTGEMGITPNDLKRSEFGKVVMSLYMHKSETPAMKRQLKALIEQWSRPIFQKSGNMRDLERVHEVRGQGGIAGLSRMQMQDQRRMEASSSGKGNSRDIDSMIKSGKGKGKGSGLNRVRVPYSKGFQYTVRPTARNVDQSPDKGAGRGQEARGNLAKRMLEKNRTVSKNQRSANISIEGRATKP